MDLALNNLQRFICHKTQPTNPKIIISVFSFSFHSKDLLSFFFFSFSFFILGFYPTVTIHRQPTPLSQLSKLLMVIRIVLWFFSSLTRGISHFFTNTQNPKYTTERVEEKKKKTITGLGYLQAQEGRRLWPFPSIRCFCELTRACTRAKFPQSHQEC